MKKIGLLILPTVLFFYGSMTCIYQPALVRVSPLVSEASSNIYGLNVLEKNDAPEKNPDTPSDQEEDSFELNLPKQDRQTSISVRVIQNNVPLPEFTRGIYLTNNTSMSQTRLKRFIQDAKKYNINTFVMDVQKKMVPKKHVLMIKKAGIFPVARVVVFLGGLKQETPNEEYIQSIIKLISQAAENGFQEVQLDYIRYADEPKLLKLSLSHKYKTINEILLKAQQRANREAVYLSADIFGRITLNKHDHIGQKLENFSRFIDSIYPMLYPSHYTGDPYRISHPYETVKEGVANSVERCERTRVVAYIQGFTMKYEESGLSFVDYIQKQLQAVEDANGHGWVIWNAKNIYTSSYTAIANYDAQKQKQDEREKSGE